MASKSINMATVMALLVKAVILAARWAGMARRSALSRLASMSAQDRDKELLFLRERVHQLEVQVAILQRQARQGTTRPRYPLKERLLIMWSLEYFQIPRRQVTRYFGVARSTLYRWLRRIEEQTTVGAVPANKTPAEIANLVWDIAMANIHWGRVRIANQLGLLKVFVAASTVRRILERPPPRGLSPGTSSGTEMLSPAPTRSISAFYPNHVWSADLTTVLRWGIWPTYVFVAIDHFSRKTVAARPLLGPNAGWLLSALEQAFREFGPPRHIITDQQGVFTSASLAAFLDDWKVKHRFGAVGKHGSITVTERVIKTLKHEWLKHAVFLRGFDHLELLCARFSEWYNSWRPHMGVGGARPDDVYCRDIPEEVSRKAKVVPLSIERRVFEEVRIVGYRLRVAA